MQKILNSLVFCLLLTPAFSQEQPSFDSDALFAKKATAYYQQGSQFLKNGDDINAVDYFTRALTLDPTHKEAQKGLTEAESKIRGTSSPQDLTSSPLAQKQLRSVTAAGFLKKYLSEAGHSLARENYIEAVIYFSKALALSPENKEALDGLRKAKGAMRSEMQTLTAQMDSLNTRHEEKMSELTDDFSQELARVKSKYQRLLTQKEREWQKKVQDINKEALNKTLLNRYKLVQKQLKRERKDFISRLRNLERDYEHSKKLYRRKLLELSSLSKRKDRPPHEIIESLQRELQQTLYALERRLSRLETSYMRRLDEKGLYFNSEEQTIEGTSALDFQQQKPFFEAEKKRALVQYEEKLKKVRSRIENYKNKLETLTEHKLAPYGVGHK